MSTRVARFDHGGADPVRVRQLVAFINAGDWREKRRLVEQDVELASEGSSRLLDGWIQAVEDQGETESADELRRYSAFLGLVHREGVSTAFEAAAESRIGPQGRPRQRP